MSKEGLGKGLNALISSKGRNVTHGSKGYILVREKEKKLQELEERIRTKKKTVEDIRKKLTIELMLSGKVDKSELNDLEEALDGLVKEKNELVESIKDLKAEMRIDIDTVESIQEESKEQDDINQAISETIGSEIDMRMVRDLMPTEKDGITEAEALEGDESDHVQRLREELDREKAAKEVRKEAYGDQEKRKAPVVKRRVMRKTPMKPADGEGPKKVVPRMRVTRRVVRKVPKKDSREVASIIKRALFLMQGGNLEEAKEILEQALQGDPGNDEILYHLGNVYFILEELETAEVLFKKSIDSNKESYRAYNNLGVVQRKLGRKESAIRSLNRSIEIEPKYERAWMNLGTLFMELDPPMLNEASIFLRRALECQPNYRKAREKLEKCQQMMEQV